MKMLIRSSLMALCLAFSPFTMAESIDINTADAATLAAAMNGVGEKRAQAIVAYREAHGPFKSVDELVRVSGIGARLLEDNRQNLRVGQE